MKKYYLSYNLYIAKFLKDIIILDIEKDQYLILDEKQSEVFEFLIFNEFNESQISNEYLNNIENFENMGLITTQYNEFTRRMNLSSLSTGIKDFFWSMQYGNLRKIITWKLFFNSFFFLLKTDYLLKYRKFFGLTEYIKKLRKNHKKNPRHIELKNIVASLDQACFYYFKHVRCLQWSTALTLILIEEGWNASLVIGVQNYAFLSHAWVEIDGNVIGDNLNLPNELSVILKIPEY